MQSSGTLAAESGGLSRLCTTQLEADGDSGGRTSTMRDAEIQWWLDQHKNETRGRGVTAVDMLELPPVLNQILRVLLAHGPMTQPRVQAALAALPDTLWPDDCGLPLALSGLVDRGWLLREGDDCTKLEPVYRVNLRTKARNTSGTGGWEALDF
jgi:hypothetical protein